VENHTLSGGHPATPYGPQSPKRAIRAGLGPRRTVAGQAAVAALGSTASKSTENTSAEKLAPIDRALEAIGPSTDREGYRRLRYALQDVAQAVLASFVDTKLCKDGVKRQVTRYKVCMCGRSSFNGQIQTDLTSKGAVYRTLKCGSAWHCPVCSAIISSYKADLLKKIIRQAEEMGYICLLVTYTARHHADSDLKQLRKAMSAAHSRVWSGGDIEEIKAHFGYLGRVRNFEVTFSPFNGPHPHIHSLVFVKRLASEEATAAMVAEFDRIFRARWEGAARAQGLTMNVRGFDVTNSTARVAEYVAKFGHDPRWQASDELTKWHKKTGQDWQDAQGLTPWGLLEFAEAGVEEAAVLFRDYAVAFHGQHQLQFSKGFLDLLGLKEEEKTDQEIVEEEQEAPVLLSVIAPQKVFAERVARIRGRARYLEMVELGDPDQVQIFCQRWFGFSPQVLVPSSGDTCNLQG
jgi:hypothetical protein